MSWTAQPDPPNKWVHTKPKITTSDAPTPTQTTKQGYGHGPYGHAPYGH
jgi:hypothetical protein